MIRRDGEWKSVAWSDALDHVARGVTQVAVEHGAQSIGAIASPMSTVEELHLLAKLVRGLGSDNIDTRLRETQPPRVGAARWLGRSIASLAELQRVFVVGSFLRKDHPLLAQRIRQATKKGAKVMSVHALRDDWLMPMGPSIAAAPSAWPAALASIAAALAHAKGVSAPTDAQANDEAKAIAAALASGEKKAVLLGNAAAQHADAEALERLGRWIAEQTGATFGWLGDGANAVGAQLVGANGRPGGLGAARMLAADSPIKAFVLLNVEPALDSADGSAALDALGRAEFVVSLTPFKPDALDEVANVVLPIAPFTETSGTFVNAEGRAQSFHGVVKPLGETRPAWKVLRVLANLLGLAGFQHETSEEVRNEAIGDGAAIAARLAAGTPPEGRIALPTQPRDGGLERIADVPIYQSDAIVRRAPALQLTADARPPTVGVPSELAAERGIVDGTPVRVRSEQGTIVLPARVDPSLASNVLRVASAHPLTVALGAMNARLELAVERAGAALSSVA
ncbi:MAG: molybdopterin-dependent oxidoreductase, partial [Rhizobacter sp.]|nr:molybdopterin-dependent oxidoreductase [Rhizobacter sp.]